MIKKRLNEKGLTLIEVLVASVLFAVIAVFVASLIIKSNETTNEIQIETKFRDEADLIMSNFIKTLYETKQSNIISFENTSDKSFLNVTNDPTKCQRDQNGNLPSQCNNTLEKIGFLTEGGKTKLYLKNQEYVLSDENISILSDSKIIDNHDGSYDITLKLQYKSVRGGNEVLKSMSFNNTIKPF